MPASGAEGSLLPRPHPQIRISGAGGASRPLRACTTCRLADSSLNEVVDANSVAADDGETLQQERIYQALSEADPKAFMGEFDVTEPITVDGCFDLLAIVDIIVPRVLELYDGTPTSERRSRRL